MPVMRLIEKMACLHSEACFGFMVTLVYYHDCGCLECLKKYVKVIMRDQRVWLTLAERKSCSVFVWMLQSEYQADRY